MLEDGGRAVNREDHRAGAAAALANRARFGPDIWDDRIATTRDRALNFSNDASIRQ